MVYFLSELFSNTAFFNLFRYITLRSVGALFWSFFLVWVTAPWFIGWIKSKGAQPLRTDGPQSHILNKQGTATMGGVLMMMAYISTLVLWVNWKNTYVWIASGVFIGCGALGAWDDFLKIRLQNQNGISVKSKFLGQGVVAVCAASAMIYWAPDALAYQLYFPFFKNIVWEMGPILFFIWAIFLMIGGSNAVNLTDGLDGLAIGPVMISCAVFALLSYISGHYHLATYLHTPFVPMAGELCVLCASLLGAGLGFLWYNCHPASIMMGDVGSLALGGFLAATSLMIKQEFLLAIVGGVFVIETVSVVIQIGVFKKTGRRFFLMTPIHHHFEEKGWSESTVVFRFWIISILLGFFALCSLKFR